MAGALTRVVVPPASHEAARDLARAREQVRGDLMRSRHRLSKLLLRHGRVWDQSTWTQTHQRWLGAQHFELVNSELAYLDNLAACQGLLARRVALDERLSHVARDPEFWPVVSRLRAFRGIDTLSALIIVLEVATSRASNAPFSWAPGLGWSPLASSPVRATPTDRSPRPARGTPGGSSSRHRGTTCEHHASASHSPPVTMACPTMSCRSRGARRSACIASISDCAHTARHRTSPRSPARASCRASCGPPPPRHSPNRQPSRSRGEAPGPRSPPARTVPLWAAHQGHARS